MIPEKIQDYVKIYNNYFSQDFCKSVISSLEKAEWQKHYYYTSAGTSLTYDDDLHMSYEPIPEYDDLHKATWNALNQYVKTDLKGFAWFNTWHNFSKIRFNKYTGGTNMKPHCDHIHSLFDGKEKGVPILSVVASLNDDYEGGEFIMWEDQKINLPAGSIMIFPSNFMYPHAVSTVTSGTRYSFVSWVW
jgi:hypothetical protein